MHSPAVAPGSKGTVLLVDDDKFLLDMYQLKFVQSGYTVRAEQSVTGALAALRDGFAPEAVVFDIIMPELTGFSLLEALQTEHLAKDAVKVALTNQGEPEEEKKAMQLGADCYLVKATFIPSEVVAAVAKEIEKKKKKA